MAEIHDEGLLNYLSNFDVEMQHLLKSLLGEKKQKVTDKRKQLTESLRIINQAECSSESKSCFDDYLNRIIYLYWYSPCYTSAVASHFCRLVNGIPWILKDSLDRRLVNICCLGGGPGTEVVALSKVLASTQDRFEQISGKPLRLRVTIVDKTVEWKETACKVLQTLVNSAEIFDQKKMVVRLRFLKADMTEPLTENVRNAVEEADVITMVAFLSSLGKEFAKNIPKLTQAITESMKSDAMLFYLDTGKSQQCRNLYKSIEAVRSIECVYGPIELEPFTLSLQSVSRNVELFGKTFHGYTCLTSAIINTCAWVKTKHQERHQTSLQNQKAVQQNSNQWRIHWKKKAMQTEEQLKAFQKKVDQILPDKKR